MITCPYCDADHDDTSPVSNGVTFVKTCDYCGKLFKVDVWVDFDTYEMEQPNPKADPAAAESASTPDVAGAGPARCWTEGQ